MVIIRNFQKRPEMLLFSVGVQDSLPWTNLFQKKKKKSLVALFSNGITLLLRLTTLYYAPKRLISFLVSVVS